ncbi:unnamed protein product [Somion occarium]|uniref:Uncharacterized protein n=1 Tax=Somion occarium TaxID=3059160 RepID=A0ABP1E6C8_9APHY
MTSPVRTLLDRTDITIQKLQALSEESQGIYKQLFTLQSSTGNLAFLDDNVGTRIHDDFRVFSDLLWKARDIAGDIRTAAIDFRYAMMGIIRDQRVLPEQKIESMEQWSHSMRPKLDSASNLPTEFSKLALDMQAVAKELEGHLAEKHQKPSKESLDRTRKPLYFTYLAKRLSRLLILTGTFHRVTSLLLRRSLKLVTGGQKQDSRAVDPLPAVHSRKRSRPCGSDVVSLTNRTSADLTSLSSKMEVFGDIYEILFKEIDELTNELRSEDSLDTLSP